jgi:hypothetical protein
MSGVCLATDSGTLSRVAFFPDDWLDQALAAFIPEGS